MLPIFPEFKKLEITDKKDIEKITSQYPPYSDFNFVSMWSWDIFRQIRISDLHGNLVVKFTDYLTGAPFYSFLGNKKVNRTAKELLEYSVEQNIEPLLKFVPEISIKKLSNTKFTIHEDRDHFDYLYDIKKVANYLGSEYYRHRKLTKQFEKNDHEVKILDLTKSSNRKKIGSLIKSWSSEKQSGTDADNMDFENEMLAFKRLFKSPPDLLSSLLCIGLFVDRNLVGFIINEKVGSKYCVAHFGKARNDYKGINHSLFKKNAGIFLDLGVSYWNDQQDLGLSGLRYSKSSYHPSDFLRKYSLSFKK